MILHVKMLLTTFYCMVGTLLQPYCSILNCCLPDAAAIIFAMVSASLLHACCLELLYRLAPFPASDCGSLTIEAILFVGTILGSISVKIRFKACMASQPSCSVQEPCCRRKAILTYFGEKSFKCQQQTELPCDYCQNPRRVCKASTSVEEALQTKALAAATPPKTSDMTDLHLLSAHCSSSSHRNSASISSPSNGLSSPACNPQSAAVWRAAASKRPAPLKPLLSHNHKLQAVAAQVKDDDKQIERVQRLESEGSQTDACGSGAVVPRADWHTSGVTNMKKPVLTRTWFKVPFKAPRPAG